MECQLSPWSELDYREEIVRKDSIFLAADDGGIIVGFLVARIFGKDSDLLNFGVSYRSRGNGIGKALFKHFIKEAIEQGIESVWLEVRKSNDDAVRFYQNQGFCIIQSRKSLYSNPTDDALLMKTEVLSKKL